MVIDTNATIINPNIAEASFEGDPEVREAFTKKLTSKFSNSWNQTKNMTRRLKRSTGFQIALSEAFVLGLAWLTGWGLAKVFTAATILMTSPATTMVISVIWVFLFFSIMSFFLSWMVRIPAAIRHTKRMQRNADQVTKRMENLINNVNRNMDHFGPVNPTWYQKKEGNIVLFPLIDNSTIAKKE